MLFYVSTQKKFKCFLHQKKKDNRKKKGRKKRKWLALVLFARISGTLVIWRQKHAS